VIVHNEQPFELYFSLLITSRVFYLTVYMTQSLMYNKVVGIHPTLNSCRIIDDRNWCYDHQLFSNQSYSVFPYSLRVGFLFAYVHYARISI